MLFRVMKVWVPLVVVATCAIAFAYVGLQQAHRMMANDPQIQIARDAARVYSVEDSEPASRTVGGDMVDVAASDAPWLDVVAANGRPGSAQAFLDGQPVAFPPGVIAAAKANGENRVTWQPRPGVRQAIVVVPARKAPGMFIVAGRSLRETEKRIDDLGLMALAAWVAVLVGSLAAVVAFEWASDRLRAGDPPGA